MKQALNLPEPKEVKFDIAAIKLILPDYVEKEEDEGEFYAKLKGLYDAIIELENLLARNKSILKEKLDANN